MQEDFKQSYSATAIDVEVTLRKREKASSSLTSNSIGDSDDLLLQLWTQREEREHVIRSALLDRSKGNPSSISLPPLIFYPGDRFVLSFLASGGTTATTSGATGGQFVLSRLDEEDNISTGTNSSTATSTWILRICDVTCPRRGIQFSHNNHQLVASTAPVVATTTTAPASSKIMRSAGGELESEYISGEGSSSSQVFSGGSTIGNGGVYDLGFNPFHPQGDDGGLYGSASEDDDDGAISGNATSGDRRGGGGGRAAVSLGRPPVVKGVVGNIYFYTNSKQEAEEEGLGSGGEEGEGGDGGGGNFTACTVLSLPNVRTEGIWESLHLSSADLTGRGTGGGSSSLKSKLLHYTTTALQLAQLSVDPNLVSFNKLILLHGPPGTGKTSVAKALAHKMAVRVKNNNNSNSNNNNSPISSPSLLLRYRQVELVEINAHSLFSRWFSESGKQVLQLFTKIKDLLEDKRCLVFILIDEVESLAAARSGTMSRGNEPSDAIRVVNSLLTQLDSLKAYPNVVMVATSNITEAIDVAFIDRADLKLYLGPPPLEAKIDILMSSILELVKRKVLGGLDDLFEAVVLAGQQAQHKTSTRGQGNDDVHVAGLEVVLTPNPTAREPSSPTEGEIIGRQHHHRAPVPSWSEKVRVLRFLLKESLRSEVKFVDRSSASAGAVQVALALYQKQHQYRAGGPRVVVPPRPNGGQGNSNSFKSNPPGQDPMPGLTGRALRKLPLLALAVCSSTNPASFSFGGGTASRRSLSGGGLFSLEHFLDSLHLSLRQELAARKKMEE